MAFVRGLGIVPGDVWVGKGRQGAKVVIVGLDPDTAEVFYSLMPVVPGRLLRTHSKSPKTFSAVMQQRPVQPSVD